MEPLQRPTGGDQDRGPVLLAMWWTELSISIIMVILRISSRFKLKSVGIDDWFMVAALVLFISTTIAVTFDITHGGARHLYYLDPPQIEYATKVTWIENPLGIMAVTTAKMSVAFLILRLIGPSTVWRKWSLYTSIVLTFIVGALACILTFVQCNPPRALWKPPSQVPGAKCWNPKRQADYAIFSSAYFSFIDFFLAVIPSTFVWNLNLKLQKKIALSMLLSLGAFAGVCSAIKTAYLKELGARADFTWATYDLAAWTAAEIFLLIVCACIPTLKPIYDFVREKPYFSLSYFTSRRSSSNSKSHYGFNGGKRQSYQKHADASSPRRDLKMNSADKVRGLSTKVTSRSDREPDPWMDGDGNALIGIGNINVQRGWEVHHGDTDPQDMATIHPLEPAPFDGAKVRSDNIV
ncbi:hypothetical protein N7G274_000392 [Stereocaulon virgatum]|uniref:Rhodopsin domain-containing protein n=1 Tax=Stereocaulon virgatum TaxID=373712 RepID=A0ABR4ATA2_9LECA